MSPSCNSPWLPVSEVTGGYEMLYSNSSSNSIMKAGATTTNTIFGLSLL